MTQLTVLFLPESAYGPTNQCIGIGKVLLERGHRVVFAAERSWEGRLAPFGFVEALVDLAPPDPEPDSGAAGQFWIDFITETAPEFRKPTIEQLATFVQPTSPVSDSAASVARWVTTTMRAPHRCPPSSTMPSWRIPALLTSGAPYVRIVSCNPLEIRGDGIAPVFSGYPQDDHAGWDGFLAEFDRVHQATWEDFNVWVQGQGAPPLPPREFMHTSETANLYVYPEELDYVDARPLGEVWTRMDSSVRETDENYELPAGFRDRPEGSSLIYLSLGSLGAADVTLLQRLIDVLATTPHKVVVSMGPRAGELSLGANMVGAEVLPQTKVIPQVDLVITHGGNNTTTESLHFGKPMIVLPLFWDQYDNAQRIQETGYGVRLATYEFTETELLEAVETLLSDTALRDRAARTGEAIRARDGLRVGADLIERVGLGHLA